MAHSSNHQAGPDKNGTKHQVSMTNSSVALLILIPLFVFTFGSALGSSYEEAIAYYARPWPAIIAGLTIVVTMLHLRGGVQAVIEDYIHGPTHNRLLLAATVFTLILAAAGLFSIIRLAF